MTKKTSQEVMAHFVKSCRDKYNKGELGAQGILNGDLDVNSSNICLYQYWCEDRSKDYRCAIGAGFDDEDIKLVKNEDRLGQVINSLISVRLNNKYPFSSEIIEDLRVLQRSHDNWSVTSFKYKNTTDQERESLIKQDESEFLSTLEKMESKYCEE